MSQLLFTKDLDKEILRQELDFREGDNVCIKLHYGEPGNKTSLPPKYAQAIIDVLYEKGAKPFLFDSSVKYHSPRNNPEGHRKAAEKQGFTEEAMGCPMVFTDDYVETETQNMSVQACRPMLEADGVIVLTHVKGHICSGMGGAIKNLGMGGVSKKTKTDIHDMAAAVYIDGCTKCGICESLCPFNFITINDQPELSGCIGCNQCVDNCPQGCFKVKVASFDTLLAEAASAVVRGKEYYINVLHNITVHCDCKVDAGQLIAEDIGVLYGNDPVSIDYASVKLVQEQAGDVWKKHNHRFAEGHVEEAQRLGMGKLSYEIKNVH